MIGGNLVNQIAADEPKYETPPIIPPIFELHTITKDELEEFIRDLKLSISCGVDGLTARLIQTTGQSLLDPPSLFGQQQHYTVYLSQCMEDRMHHTFV